MYIYKTKPSNNHKILKKLGSFFILLILSAISFACGRHDDKGIKVVTLAEASAEISQTTADVKPQEKIVKAETVELVKEAKNANKDLVPKPTVESIASTANAPEINTPSAASEATKKDLPKTAASSVQNSSEVAVVPADPVKPPAPTSDTAAATTSATTTDTAATATTPATTVTSSANTTASIATDPNFEILEFVLANKIEAREPKEVVENYAKDANNAYAFARLRAKQHAPLTFVWICEGKERARFTTQVQMAKSWRTFATTKIRPGNWKVQLLSENQVIAERSFVVE